MNIVLALTGSQESVIMWTIVGLVVIGIVLVFIAAVTMFGSWGTPKVERLQKGQKMQPGEKPCCPAGVGCNDPSDRITACRREVAMTSTTDVDDLKMLESSWTKFNSLPKWRTGARRKALAAFEGIRDRIFYERIVEDKLKTGSDKLSLGAGPSGEETVSDVEVMPEP